MCCEVEDSSLNVPTRADLEHEVKEYRLIKAMIVDKLEGFSNYALSISREDFREHLHGEISGVIEVYITETAKHFRKMLAVCINNKAHIFGELCENLSESIDSDLPAANPLWGDISSMTYLELGKRIAAKLGMELDPLMCQQLQSISYVDDGLAGGTEEEMKLVEKKGTSYLQTFHVRYVGANPDETL